MSEQGMHESTHAVLTPQRSIDFGTSSSDVHTNTNECHRTCACISLRVNVAVVAVAADLSNGRAKTWLREEGWKHVVNTRARSVHMCVCVPYLYLCQSVTSALTLHVRMRQRLSSAPLS